MREVTSHVCCICHLRHCVGQCRAHDAADLRGIMRRGTCAHTQPRAAPCCSLRARVAPHSGVARRCDSGSAHWALRMRPDGCARSKDRTLHILSRLKIRRAVVERVERWEKGRAVW